MDSQTGKIIKEVTDEDIATVQAAIAAGKHSVNIQGHNIRIIDGEPQMLEVPPEFNADAFDCHDNSRIMFRSKNSKAQEWAKKQRRKTRKKIKKEKIKQKRSKK